MNFYVCDAADDALVTVNGQESVAIARIRKVCKADAARSWHTRDPSMTPNRATTLHDYHERLNRVRLYIDQHRSEKLTLETLAAVACLSPFHFHRIYSAMTGETVADTIRRCRLQRAYAFQPSIALAERDSPVVSGV